MSSYTLIGAPLSYYSGKARAYLRWKGVEFEEQLSSPDVMKDVLPVIGWPVIPVLRLPDGRLVQDTLDIIETIEAATGGVSVEPEDPLMHAIGRTLHLYGDEWLLIPAMHYRWNHNEDWVYGEFGKVAAPDADPETQDALGRKRATMFRGIVPMLGINEQTIPAVEASYEAFLHDLEAHFASHQFLLGGRPTLADFGFYGPLYAHLYRDPASGALMRRTAPHVVEWVERLRSGDYENGTLETAPPETLKPILKRYVSEHAPILRATAAQFAAWAEGNAPDTELPRAFGQAATEISGQAVTTLSRSFSLFRLQNVQEADMAEAKAWLPELGTLSDIALAKPLKRENYKLVLGE